MNGLGFSQVLIIIWKKNLSQPLCALYYAIIALLPLPLQAIVLSIQLSSPFYIRKIRDL